MRPGLMRKSPAVGAEARRKVRREWELGPGKWEMGIWARTAGVFQLRRQWAWWWCWWRCWYRSSMRESTAWSLVEGHKMSPNSESDIYFNFTILN